MSQSGIRNLPTAPVVYEPLPFEGEDGHRSPYSYPSDSYSMEDLHSAAARPRFVGHPDGSSSYRDSYSAQSANNSTYHLNPDGGSSTYSTLPPGANRFSAYDVPATPRSPTHPFLTEKNATYASPRQKKRRLGLISCVLVGVLLLIAAAVALVYFLVIKPHKNSSDDGSSGSSSGAPKPSSSSGVRTVVTGGDGSTVTRDDGSTFTYQNSFGGVWYWDPNDPFNNAAQAQSWSPPLNQSFNFGVDIIRGVNLGGWLNTEPFISPALYEKYGNSNPVAVDEWTLCQNMRADTSEGGGIQQLEDHYKTFITEDDFAAIAAAGLNWVRIPLGYWAIETRGDEPFLAKTSWTYFLKAIQWARKYGLRINLDFHALPGSQNGWNHSGRLGTINVLLGPMGYANAQRSLDYIRILAEFISQPEYKDVIPLFGIMNEPQATNMGQTVLSRFYLEAYNTVRNVGGIGQGNGPVVSFHDGFLGQNNWAGFLPGADRIAMDTHPYLCFAAQSAAPLDSFVEAPCTGWAANMNTSMTEFGFNAAGEFSLAVNDCGEFVNGVGLGTRFEGTYPGVTTVTGSCASYLAWQNWSDATKQSYMQLALHSMDALQNWFFWTWKIGNSTASGTVMAPHWSYQLGLENGWMPTDPRAAIGACGGGSPFVGPLAPSNTGGAGAGNIPASVTSSLAWPPPSISGGGAITLLPSYTPTAAVPTLTPPTFTITSGKSTKTANAGDGWFNTADKAGLMTDIAGCSYLDPWVGSAAPPSPLCSAGVAKRDPIPEPQLTAAPARP